MAKHVISGSPVRGSKWAHEMEILPKIGSPLACPKLYSLVWR
jgi:hypothetical protein